MAKLSMKPEAAAVFTIKSVLRSAALVALTVLGSGSSPVQSRGAHIVLVAASSDSATVFLAGDWGYAEPLPLKFPRGRSFRVGSGNPTLSPAGQFIVFVRNGNLRFVELPSRQEIPITSLPSAPPESVRTIEIIQWNGGKLLYCISKKSGPDTDPNPPKDFFVFDPETRESRRVVLPTGRLWCWLEDGRFVAFGSSRLPSEGDGVVACAPGETRGRVLIPDHDGACRMDPREVAANPHESKFAFICDVPGPVSSSQILEVNATTAERRAITEAGRSGEFEQLSYSPSGRHLAFVDRLTAPALRVDGRGVTTGSFELVPESYSWISDRALAVVSHDSLRVVNVETGLPVGSPVPVR